MNAAWLHLTSAHLVAVLVPVAALLGLIAQLAHSKLMLRTAAAFLVVAAFVAGVAYFSGSPALGSIDPEGSVFAEQAEPHAFAARIAFTVVVLAGALALVALLEELQGEALGRVLPWVVVLAALLAVVPLVWAAHLGGVIRHPEIGASITVLPETP